MVTLIATLGTRDIQFNSSLRPFLTQNKLALEEKKISFTELRNTLNMVLENPRDAEFILNRPDILQTAELPILQPVLEYLEVRHKQIDKLVLVCTNQADAAEHFRKNDTLFYAALIEKIIPKLLRRKITAIEKLEITERVSEIDFQYVYFRRVFKDYALLNEATALYLLAQGGIDQINTAIMLRLIEKNPEVKLLQVPELGEIKTLDFPRQFAYNLTKHKALELLDNSHYAGVAALVEGPASFISLLTDALINLSKPTFITLWNAPDNKRSIEVIKNRNAQFFHALNDLNLDDEDLLWPLRIYESAKVRYRQGNMADMLWRLFALSELILKRPLEREFDITFNDGPSFAKLNRLVIKEKALSNRLETYLKIKPGTVTPGYAVLLEIGEYFGAKGHPSLLTPVSLAKVMKELRELRNSLVHTGTGLDENSLKRWLKNHGTTLESLFHKLDAYFELNSDYPCGLPDHATKMIREMVN